ncbi:MAG: orotidine-5'-phosphate decarboxylase [Candidatus Marinimicrobia bacterium]|nr:orotidine-5'-phosphate decarboxylase [Candidatus Neomarinimicrobiota bacterium]|tara:strand:- start:6083 stop:6892 length:810 start_codon:yes stop_codon:yes gene_type:complete
MNEPFFNKLRNQCDAKQSRLCIGLDIDFDLFPERIDQTVFGAFDFLKEIIDSTHKVCVAYKLNMAFFEQFGYKGYQLMEKTVEYIDNRAITICDGKRGDIGNSSNKYAKSIFSHIGFDSATISPYMGKDSIIPFLEDSRFGVFVLCLTSNPSSIDIQRIKADSKPIYLHIIDIINKLNNKNIGIVVGATQNSEMSIIREKSPSTSWLIPGIGKQGGSLEESVNFGNSNGAYGLISVSRDILFYNNSEQKDIFNRTIFYHNQIGKILYEK